MNTDTKIRQAQMPRVLNGYPVKAFSIADDERRALVLVHREGHFMPWVAATWWPELGSDWMWGNYFYSWEQADDYRAAWCRTYAAGSKKGTAA